MQVTMLRAKIHRATVKEARLDYVGSITIDEALLEKSGILEYEKVQIVNVNTGDRFETYTIAGERNSGMICLNGAAARLAQINDKVIIMAYANVDIKEAKNHKPCVVFVDDDNQSTQISHYEKHGTLA
ncbi:aspartate 1-decarboxylase [Campylobacter sp. US33a]|uniref:Aspartate 1-decarboxylase n=1 Tax=Campylobacter sp. CCS1377 TaxID=3158229 RepID=A0AAU7E5Y2_9BACT|nr:aspartate 1-decarboxylase [Campylobacter sp. US33a]MCW1360825.1 aspartate 1-decarboxylase [Campylobacter jejuni]TEY01154.1 aspartate 1-decarboxylase [Campylobacter sp. US33a]